MTVFYESIFYIKQIGPSVNNYIFSKKNLSILNDNKSNYKENVYRKIKQINDVKIK